MDSKSPNNAGWSFVNIKDNLNPVDFKVYLLGQASQINTLMKGQLIFANVRVFVPKRIHAALPISMIDQLSSDIVKEHAHILSVTFNVVEKSLSEQEIKGEALKTMQEFNRNPAKPVLH